MIVEEEDAKSASDSEGCEVEAPTERMQRSAVKRKGENQMSVDETSENSSSKSGSDDSKSNNGSESEAKDEEGTVKSAGASKEVKRPVSSNTGEGIDDEVQNPAQKSTKEVSEKDSNVDEKGKSSKITTKTIGKSTSTSTQNV